MSMLLIESLFRNRVVYSYGNFERTWQLHWFYCSNELSFFCFWRKKCSCDSIQVRHSYLLACWSIQYEGNFELFDWISKFQCNKIRSQACADNRRIVNLNILAGTIPLYYHSALLSAISSKKSYWIRYQSNCRRFCCPSYIFTQFIYRFLCSLKCFRFVSIYTVSVSFFPLSLFLSTFHQ